MTAIKNLKASVRASVGKGAARAERRAGRVPAVIYGDKKPPLPISLDYKQTYYTIYAGHFLTTIFDIDVDGTTHRVIPKDYALDVVKDTPMHVDFLRLAAGAKVKVKVPVHTINPEQSPGVKAGATINIVEHTVELLCPVEEIPNSIDVDLAGLNIGASVHLAQVKLPANCTAVTTEDHTLVTLIAPNVKV